MVWLGCENNHNRTAIKSKASRWRLRHVRAD